VEVVETHFECFRRGEVVSVDERLGRAAVEKFCECQIIQIVYH